MISEKLSEKLRSEAGKNKPIFILGINALGEEFETKAKIAKTSYGKWAIFDKDIFLDFSDDLEERSNEELYARFKTFSDFGEKCMGDLLILQIKNSRDEILFVNPCTAYLIKHANIMKQAQKNWIKTHRREQEIETKRMLDLKKRIGKPIKINQNCRILASVLDEYDENIQAVVLSSQGYEDVVIKPDDFVRLGGKYADYLKYPQK